MNLIEQKNRLRHFKFVISISLLPYRGLVVTYSISTTFYRGCLFILLLYWKNKQTHYCVN